MTIFEENEKLKEDLCLNHNAWEAKSILFRDGVPIIPETFLETTVRWDKDTDGFLISTAMKKILNFKEKMGNRCFVTPPEYETVYGHPQAIWGIFKDEEDIFVTQKD